MDFANGCSDLFSRDARRYIISFLEYLSLHEIISLTSGSPYVKVPVLSKLSHSL